MDTFEIINDPIDQSHSNSEIDYTSHICSQNVNFTSAAENRDIFQTNAWHVRSRRPYQRSQKRGRSTRRMRRSDSTDVPGLNWREIENDQDI